MVVEYIIDWVVFMAREFSLCERGLVLDLVARGLNLEEVGVEFGCSASEVGHLLEVLRGRWVEADLDWAVRGEVEVALDGDVVLECDALDALGGSFGGGV